NYMVFCPSYQYLGELAAVLEEGPEQKLREGLEQETKECLESGTQEPFRLLIQESRMDEAAREAFLAEFEVKGQTEETQAAEMQMTEMQTGEMQTAEKAAEKSLVALCVMGGIFSEGIDLKEESLIGAIIIGTGLPMVCPEQDILKDYFDRHQKPGFAYAYQYPGMNKVMQSAGRVIRTVKDEGVIALLDDRFLKPDYQALFPREWNDCRPVTLQTVGREVEAFWKGRTPSFASSSCQAASQGQIITYP
ncbi:MAG: helicase C-terminal domain-containing protein, partial [Lachnospiraceae bacterium]|nr:helicase C-terminal domain-containing protein [Lachnospiraceae bacterium]